MHTDRANVAVRNHRGIHWTETWSKEKLTYFILMSDLDSPRFQQSLQTEWVPCDVNQYKWDKTFLTLKEFEAIATTFPGQFAIEFDPASCDRVQFNYTDGESMVAVGFNPKDHKSLFESIIAGLKPIAYKCFYYRFARHIFVAEIPSEELFRRGGADLRLACPPLVADLRTGGIEVVKVNFACSHGTFELPFQLWYEL